MLQYNRKVPETVEQSRCMERHPSLLMEFSMEAHVSDTLHQFVENTLYYKRLHVDCSIGQCRMCMSHFWRVYTCSLFDSLTPRHREWIEIHKQFPNFTLEYTTAGTDEGEL